MASDIGITPSNDGKSDPARIPGTYGREEKGSGKRREEKG